jgi:hypothetical protein
MVNNNRDKRRQSAYQPQSYEKVYNDYVTAQAVDDQYNAERRREKRSSRVIVEPARQERQERQERPERFMPGGFENDEDDESEEEPEPVRALSSRPRRKTESDPRRGKERPSEVKNKRENDVEAYINSTRGSHAPFADHVNKAALTKKSRIASEPSDSGSSRSNGSGNRTTMTNANNEIRLRVDGTMPLSLQLTGDMDGRTLQLVPAENGMTDLVIGGGNNIRSGETVYRSERGSMSGINPNFNRRSLITGQGRREAEEASERSSRSARSRRGHDEILVREERAPLRRRGHTTYHWTNSGLWTIALPQTQLMAYLRYSSTFVFSNFLHSRFSHQFLSIYFHAERDLQPKVSHVHRRLHGWPAWLKSLIRFFS